MSRAGPWRKRRQLGPEGRGLGWGPPRPEGGQKEGIREAARQSQGCRHQELPLGRGCWGRRWSWVVPKVVDQSKARPEHGSGEQCHALAGRGSDWQGGARSQWFKLPGAFSSSGTALI